MEEKIIIKRSFLLVTESKALQALRTEPVQGIFKQWADNCWSWKVKNGINLNKKDSTAFPLLLAKRIWSILQLSSTVIIHKQETEHHMPFSSYCYPELKLDIQHELVAVQKTRVEGFPRIRMTLFPLLHVEISVFAERLFTESKRLRERLHTAHPRDGRGWVDWPLIVLLFCSSKSSWSEWEKDILNVK